MDSEMMKKFKELKMESSDWSKLSNTVNSDEYRSLVNDYQKRENETRPVCDTLFGTCRYCGYDFKCGYKGYCNHKMKK